MASTVRSTALILDAFAQIDPENTLVPGIVRYLMGQRRAYGWGSTNETAFTVIALTDHLLSLQADNAETGYRIELNGVEISAGTLGRGQASITLELRAAQLQTGANLLQIIAEGEGRLYYAVVNRVYLAQAQIEAAGPVQVTRTYTSVDTPAATTLQAGELVRVTLNITFDQDASFVIIEDPLPGGLEALNESLNTTSHVATADDCWEYCDPIYYWEDYGYNNKEVHPDRVTFFITEVAAGKITITYLARATHSGTFAALPTEVYAMYDPSIWGRSASSLMAILPR